MKNTETGKGMEMGLKWKKDSLKQLHEKEKDSERLREQIAQLERRDAEKDLAITELELGDIEKGLAITELELAVLGLQTAQAEDAGEEQAQTSMENKDAKGETT